MKVFVRIKHYILYFLLSLNLISCGDKGNRDIVDIDNFIYKYKDEDFSLFQNYTIEIRQSTFKETIYIVSSNSSGLNINSTLFFVYLNDLTNAISKIEQKDILRKELPERILTEEEISDIIYQYKKYNFPYLSVDTDNNAVINPFDIGGKPFFLKLDRKSNDTLIKKTYTFKHYKDNWYIRE